MIVRLESSAVSVFGNRKQLRLFTKTCPTLASNRADRRMRTPPRQHLLVVRSCLVRDRLEPGILRLPVLEVLKIVEHRGRGGERKWATQRIPLVHMVFDSAHTQTKTQTLILHTDYPRTHTRRLEYQVERARAHTHTHTHTTTDTTCTLY